MNYLEKPFVSNTDIVKFLKCSPSKASRIRKHIEDKLAAQGRQLATNDIPTKLFLEFMNLDIQTLRNASGK